MSHHQEQAAGHVELSARSIPVPAHISAVAQQYLTGMVAMTKTAGTNSIFPQSYLDKEAWREAVQASDAVFDPYLQMMMSTVSTAVEKQVIAGVDVYVAEPEAGRAGREGKIILHIHGGGFAMLADGRYAAYLAAHSAERSGCAVYSVNYRVPPDFPFPTPIDDCLAVYRELLGRYGAENIAVQGESAGGNLAAAMILKARDAGLPLPSMAILLSPAFDMTRGGDSHMVNRGLDLTLGEGISAMIDVYLSGVDATDPLASPIFADFSAGFPRTFLKAGGREILLSDSILMHRALRRSGIEAELHIWEGLSHGPFGPPMAPAPEDQEIETEIEAFIAHTWGT